MQALLICTAADLIVVGLPFAKCLAPRQQLLPSMDMAFWDDPTDCGPCRGLAVFNVRTQRNMTGDWAIRDGCNPNRRSVVWSIGMTILRVQSARTGSSRRCAPPTGGSLPSWLRRSQGL